MCAGVRADTEWISIECMQESGGYQLDIHWVYALVRQILTAYPLGVCRGPADTEWISIECPQGSGRYRLDIPLGVCRGSGGILIRYSLHVCRGQADTDWIFIGCMQRLGDTDQIFMQGRWILTDIMFL